MFLEFGKVVYNPPSESQIHTTDVCVLDSILLDFAFAVWCTQTVMINWRLDSLLLLQDSDTGWWGISFKNKIYLQIYKYIEKQIWLKMDETRWTVVVVYTVIHCVMHTVCILENWLNPNYTDNESHTNNRELIRFSRPQASNLGVLIVGSINQDSVIYLHLGGWRSGFTL